MELKLRWSKRALSQFDSIAEYIAQDNPVRAESFSKELRKKIEILKFQQIGVAGKVFGTKEYVLHPNYVAMYRVVKNEVQIITIFHTAQQR